MDYLALTLQSFTTTCFLKIIGVKGDKRKPIPTACMVSRFHHMKSFLSQPDPSVPEHQPRAGVADTAAGVHWSALGFRDSAGSGLWLHALTFHWLFNYVPFPMTNSTPGTLCASIGGCESIYSQTYLSNTHACVWISNYMWSLISLEYVSCLEMLDHRHTLNCTQISKLHPFYTNTSSRQKIAPCIVLCSPKRDMCSLSIKS